LQKKWCIIIGAAMVAPEFNDTFLSERHAAPLITFKESAHIALVPWWFIVGIHIQVEGWNRQSFKPFSVVMELSVLLDAAAFGFHLCCGFLVMFSWTH
jgi:hypothetical protein